MYELHLFILKRNIKRNSFIHFHSHPGKERSDPTTLFNSEFITLIILTVLCWTILPDSFGLEERKYIELEILFLVILYFTGCIFYLSLFCYCSVSSLSLSLTLAVWLHYSNVNQSHQILIETERQTTPIGLHISVL